MKALVGAFNQEKSLVGAFSVIVKPVVEPMDRFAALVLYFVPERFGENTLYIVRGKLRTLNNTMKVIFHISNRLI